MLCELKCVVGLSLFFVLCIVSLGFEIQFDYIASINAITEGPCTIVNKTVYDFCWNNAGCMWEAKLYLRMNTTTVWVREGTYHQNAAYEALTKYEIGAIVVCFFDPNHVKSTLAMQKSAASSSVAGFGVFAISAITCFSGLFTICGWVYVVALRKEEREGYIKV